MENQQAKQLAEEKISKLLIKFSVPAIIGMLVNALYNVVDRIFVGNMVGYEGLAGITICFPPMLVLMSFGMLIGLGGTALVSIRLGQKKTEEAEKILGNALTMLLWLCTGLMLLGLIFIDPILKVCGASAAILPVAKSYLRIILWCSIFQHVGFSMNTFIRAEGNPKIAMYTMLIGALLNTILDPIFIGYFKLGVVGAAWATVISMMASAAWVLYYYISGKSILRLHFHNMKIDWSIVKEILIIGMAPFAMQLASSLINVILNNSLVKYGGDIAVSAMGIVNSFIMFLIVPIFGINQGAQPIIGYNYGANQFKRVKKTLTLAIAAATVISIIGFLIVELFPKYCVMLFCRDNEELLQLTSRALRIVMALMPIVGYQMVSSNYFQAVGKPKQAMFLSLSRQVIFLIPALLILPRFLQLDGVFWASPAADILSAIVTAIWIAYEMKHLDDKHAATINE